MIPEDNLKRRVSIVEHVFLQYGAGSKFFRPLTSWRLWNRICWTLIATGIVAWVAMFWFLSGLSE